MRKPKVKRKKVVRAVLLYDNKEMLLVRQKARQLWQFPGGLMYADEKPEQAVLREVREETRLRLKNLALIHTEKVLTDVVEEVIFTFFGTIGKSKTSAPDGKEIDMLARVSISQAFDMPLTDTTKVLLSNISIIELFV